MQLLKIICTIEKTGTHSLAFFEHDKIMHCTEEALDWVKGNHVMTCYRDPFRTAASWWNASPQMLWRTSNWKKQWDVWGEIVRLGAKVYKTTDLPAHYNKGVDVTGLHDLLNRNDYRGFYRKVPKKDIDHAFKVVAEVM